MSGQMQVRNSQLVRLLSGDFQLRYEPNFAWKSACSAVLALPALRAFWPMSSVDYTVASRARDIAGGSYHLTDNNTPLFNYDALAPYCSFDGVNQFLDRADGGATNWADVTGLETYVDNAVRGLTFGGWFYLNSIAAGIDIFMSKWLVAGNQRSYMLYWQAGNTVCAVSGDGTAVDLAISAVAMAATTWTFLVGRFDPSTRLSIFLNATETPNVAGIPAQVFDGTADFNVGAYLNGTAGFLGGRTSMCWLCAAYLSDAQILSVFEQQKALYGVT